jgi:hypothetical protein
MLQNGVRTELQNEKGTYSADGRSPKSNKHLLCLQLFGLAILSVDVCSSFL